jgi:hypothetical protein
LTSSIAAMVFSYSIVTTILIMDMDHLVISSATLRPETGSICQTNSGDSTQKLSGWVLTQPSPPTSECSGLCGFLEVRTSRTRSPECRYTHRKPEDGCTGRAGGALMPSCVIIQDLSSLMALCT